MESGKAVVTHLGEAFHVQPPWCCTPKWGLSVQFSLKKWEEDRLAKRPTDQNHSKLNSDYIAT